MAEKIVFNEEEVYNLLGNKKYKVPEVAKLLGCCTETLRNYLRKTDFFNKHQIFPECPNRKFFCSYISKEFLIENFIKKEYSANYIGENLIFIFNQHYKIGAGQIIKLLKHYQIPSRNISQSCFATHSRESKKQTCIKNYGVENPSQSIEIQKKKEQTFLKHYGVKNIFEGDMGKKVARDGMMKKYGVPYNVYTDEYKKCKHKQFNKSKPQTKVEDYLKSQNVNFDREVYNLFYRFNEELGKEYNPRPDIILSDKNIVIEVYGDYWHANPKYYKPNDIIYTWQGQKKAKDLWKHDKIRVDQIKSFKYNIIIIWEDDIKTDKFQQILKENGIC